MSFEKFTSRITIRGQLTAETGLHIGSGGVSLDPAATDSPIIRDAAGRPFIPGSSLKGALRAHLESLVRSLARQHFWSCDPLAEPCISAEDMNRIKDWAKEKATEDGRTDQAKADRLLTDKINSRSCAVCKLFGSPWLASHVLIKDAFVVAERWGRRIELRDGVGIDRDTETARQGVKYDFEVVPATTGFALEIVAENTADDDELIGLLSIGLRELAQGRVALGGKTTRGLGGVRFDPTEIEVISGVGLLDYLINGQGQLLQGGKASEYLAEKAKALADKLKARSEDDAQEVTQ